MELLRVELGSITIAIAPSQIRRIVAADNSPPPWVSLSEALGYGEGFDCPRVLVCDGKDGERAFGIPSAAHHWIAPPGSLVGLTSMLRRFQPPLWLSGFVVEAGWLGLLVHLWHVNSAVPHLSSTPWNPHL